MITLGGTDAVPGIRICTATNAAVHTANTANKTIIGQSFHLYTEPPHWKAINRHTTPGKKKNMPNGSSLLTWTPNGTFSCLSFGGFHQNTINTRATAPMGRLM